MPLDALQALKASAFRILLTVVPPKPFRDGDEARSMLESEGLPLFKGSIRRLAAFAKAGLAGTFVSEVDEPRAPGGIYAVEVGCS